MGLGVRTGRAKLSADREAEDRGRLRRQVAGAIQQLGLRGPGDRAAPGRERSRREGQVGPRNRG